MPRPTTLSDRSCSVRLVAAAAAADFFTSAMPRLTPAIRFLRILKSVKQAPTSMPPTAIGRTMNRHRWATIAPQAAVSLPPFAAMYWSISPGPRKKMSSGTNRPHASRPPAKFSAPSSGPMM